ncbi:MAG: FeoB-associated Cys-rich membrane protein [Flavobacteriaceae bacterium]|nr:FeoB-associated Cys-rich membrane protein [Flavobacteriaceae bacterium]
MGFQEIIVYVILGLAVLYLVRKIFFKPNQNKDCNPDCGC